MLIETVGQAKSMSRSAVRVEFKPWHSHESGSRQRRAAIVMHIRLKAMPPLSGIAGAVGQRLLIFYVVYYKWNQTLI